MRLSYPILLPVAMLLVLVACDRGAHPPQLNIPAPDFTVKDSLSSIHLADYRGKVVLLNFWATWCGPCIAEMPSLQEFQRENPQIVVLAISVDEDEAAYRSFLMRHHVNLITVRDPKETVADLYHTDMWPETYAIDRNGTIRRKFVGSKDWSDPEIARFLHAM